MKTKPRPCLSSTDQRQLADLLLQPGRDLNEAAIEGLIERIDLWLRHPEFFEKMITMVRDKSLRQHPEVFTSEKLIDYIATFRGEAKAPALI